MVPTFMVDKIAAATMLKSALASSRRRRAYKVGPKRRALPARRNTPITDSDPVSTERDVHSSYYNDWSEITIELCPPGQQRKRKIASEINANHQRMRGWSTTIAQGSRHIIRPISRRAVVKKRTVAKVEHKTPPKNIMDLPLEIQRHIMSYLFEDLPVVIVRGGVPGNVKVAALRASQKESLQHYIGAKAASRRFNGLFMEALKFACERKDAALIVDTRMSTRHTGSRLDGDLSWTAPRTRVRYGINMRQMELYTAVEILIPVKITIATIPRTSAVRLLRVRLENHIEQDQPASVSMSWSTISSIETEALDLVFHEAFEWLVRMFKEEMTLSVWAKFLDCNPKVGVPWIDRILIFFNIDTKRTRLSHHWWSFATSQQSIDTYAEEIKHQKEQSRHGSAPLRQFRLSWRGSKALAEKRRALVVVDEEATAAAADWLTRLSVVKVDKLDLPHLSILHGRYKRRQAIQDANLAELGNRLADLSVVDTLAWLRSQIPVEQGDHQHNITVDDVTLLADRLNTLAVYDGQTLEWRGMSIAASSKLSRRTQLELIGPDVSMIVDWLGNLLAPDAAQLGRMLKPILSTLRNLKGAELVGLIVVGDFIDNRISEENWPGAKEKVWEHIGGEVWPERTAGTVLRGKYDKLSGKVEAGSRRLFSEPSKQSLHRQSLLKAKQVRSALRVEFGRRG